MIKSRYETWKQDLLSQAKNRSGLRPSPADQANLPFVDMSGMALPPGGRKTPRWLADDGLCFIGCWECLPWRRYSGIATTWAEDDYAFEHSQAFLDDIKKLGCNAVVIPYDCGHGEALNEDEAQRSRAFIELAHRNGLKVGTYFRPDIVWVETLSDTEWKELEGCFQIDSQGRFIQPFGSAAKNVCYHHAGALARFKRHVQRVIVELKTDMLHLDGMIIGNMEGGGACRCPQCVEDFRRFLVKRYGKDRETAQRRFGHPFMEKVNPPLNYPLDSAPYDSGPIKPNWCEWVAFRCEWTSRILAEVAAWTKELNPEVAIEINNALPAVRENAPLLIGTDPIGIGYYTDASWSEDGYGPQLHDNGLLIHRIRQFKLCRAAGTFGLTYMHEQAERTLRQNLAHTAAFNLGNIGCIGFPPHMNFSNRYTVHFETKCNFMRWLNEHRPYYRGGRSAAQIAVWRARENLAISGKLAYAATMRLEQLLVETCRGFDLVFDESPAALAGYDLVIVPNLECMSLDQIDGLMAYVEKGGGLLVGQDSALCDLWHRRRIEDPWAALFGKASAKNVVADAVADGVAGIFVAANTQSEGDAITLVNHGKGRAAYCPMVVNPATQPSLMTVHGGLDTGLDHTNWVVPEKAGEFNRAIDWLLEDKQKYSVKGERGLLAEFMAQDKPKRLMVHLVNLRAEPLSHCNVVMHKGSSTSDVNVLFPPTDLPPKWEIKKADGSLKVEITGLDTYAVVVMTCK